MTIPDSKTDVQAKAVDLRELLLTKPSEFFRTIGENVFILDRDFQPLTGPGGVRGGVLALDQLGRALVVQLQGEGELPDSRDATLLTTIVRQCETEHLIRKLTPEEAEDLGVFLTVPVEGVNLQQRIIMVSSEDAVEITVSRPGEGPRKSVSSVRFAPSEVGTVQADSLRGAP